MCARRFCRQRSICINSVALPRLSQVFPGHIPSRRPNYHYIQATCNILGTGIQGLGDTILSELKKWFRYSVASIQWLCWIFGCHPLLRARVVPQDTAAVIIYCWPNMINVCPGNIDCICLAWLVLVSWRASEQKLFKNVQLMISVRIIPEIYWYVKRYFILFQ